MEFQQYQLGLGSDTVNTSLTQTKNFQKISAEIGRHLILIGLKQETAPNLENDGRHWT